MLNSILIIVPAFKTCTSLSRTGNASLKNKIKIKFNILCCFREHAPICLLDLILLYFIKHVILHIKLNNRNRLKYFQTNKTAVVKLKSLLINLSQFKF